MQNTTAPNSQSRLGDLLVQKKLISQGQLDRALAEQKVVRKRLGEVLLSTRAITREQLEKVLTEQRFRRVPGQVTGEAHTPIAEIAEQIFAARTITQIEQELLMSILLSEEDLGYEEQQLIERLFDGVRTGWIRVI
jgi:hypothetical protein